MRTAWNKGKKTGKLSEAHRAKLSAALTGHVKSEETLAKQTATKRRNGTIVMPVKKGESHSWGDKISVAMRGNRNFRKEHTQHRTDVGKREYEDIHAWVRKTLGKPSTCWYCKRTDLFGHSIHWSNISCQYKKDVTDWVRLCAKCHLAYDNGTINIDEISPML
jgi:hypothetical protein